MELILLDIEPLAIGEKKIFPNASVPQCKVYVPWGKQHSTLLLECSTVKESVWDLALRFKDSETLLGWADENTQAWGPSAVKTQYVVIPGAPRTDTPKDKLPPKTGDSVRLFRFLCYSTPPFHPEILEDVKGRAPDLRQPTGCKGQWGLWKENQKVSRAIFSHLPVFLQEMTSTRNGFTTPWDVVV